MDREPVATARHTSAAGTVIYIGTAYITGSKILKDSLELIRKKKGHEQ